MRCARSRWRSFLAALAALVVAAGLALEAWCATDRARAPGRAHDVAAAEAAARTHPSAAAYERLAGAALAAGRASDAATAAVVASKLAPGDARRAALAEAAVDAALRATLRDGVRPVAGVGAVLLLALWVAGARVRARTRAREAAIAGALARVVLAVEGEGTSRGDRAQLTAATTALVVDVHADPVLDAVPDRPPLVVTLSHGEAGRTVRLAPRRDVGGGAARFRVAGDALREVLAHAGRWRLLVRMDGALLGTAEVVVAPRATARAAA